MILKVLERDITCLQAVGCWGKALEVWGVAKSSADIKANWLGNDRIFKIILCIYVAYRLPCFILMSDFL